MTSPRLTTLERNMLKDPRAVYLNMLRGGIATPSPDNLVLLCKDRAAMLDALKRENPELFTVTVEDLADIERRIQDAARLTVPTTSDRYQTYVRLTRAAGAEPLTFEDWLTT